MVSEVVVLTPKEIAKICKVSLRLIYRQLRNGTIPHVKCGDKYLISQDALSKWLSGGNPPSAPTGTAG